MTNKYKSSFYSLQRNDVVEKNERKLKINAIKMKIIENLHRIIEEQEERR